MPARSLLALSARRLAAALVAFGLSFGPAMAGPHLLVDVKTGKVLEQEDAFRKWYPASLTKMMTAYTVFHAIEQGKISLETKVVMSKAAAGQPASKMYLKPGDWMTMDAALKILLTKSANDVAWAIGETVSGSVPAFVAQMNADARSIGMSSSRFVNPNGLPGKGQYTTARDLAVLAVTIKRSFPQYGHYFALQGISTGKKAYPNYNMLIGRYAGADGMKTGFICASGFNQVSSATRDGRTMVSVVLGSESLAARADLSANLLEKGFGMKTFGAPSLAALKPSGENTAEVADLSKDICSKHGKKVRSESKDEAGRNKLESPFIREMAGEPLVELVVINPAGKGDGKDAGEELANIPIPEPRPLN